MNNSIVIAIILMFSSANGYLIFEDNDESINNFDCNLECCCEETCIIIPKFKIDDKLLQNFTVNKELLIHSINQMYMFGGYDTRVPPVLRFSDATKQVIMTNMFNALHALIDMHKRTENFFSDIEMISSDTKDHAFIDMWSFNRLYRYVEDLTF